MVSQLNNVLNIHHNLEVLENAQINVMMVQNSKFTELRMLDHTDQLMMPSLILPQMVQLKLDSEFTKIS
jgi:hypothetical protein